MKSLFRSVRRNVKRNWTRILAFAVVVVMSVMMLGVSVFAAVSDPVLTSSMLEPVLEGAKENIAVIVPVGIGLFVIILSISLIPIIFKKFSRH